MLDAVPEGALVEAFCVFDEWRRFTLANDELRQDARAWSCIVRRPSCNRFHVSNAARKWRSPFAASASSLSANGRQIATARAISLMAGVNASMTTGPRKSTSRSALTIVGHGR